MDDITPDFAFPGSHGLRVIVSYFLGAGLTLSFLAVVVLGIMIAFKGFGNQGMQQGAAKLIGWTFVGLVVLGSASAIWQFVVGFDLGI